MEEDPKQTAAVPTGRSSRLLHMSGVVAAIAGGVMAGGLRQLASGQRPDLPNLLLTPSNALRLTSGLSHLRGAALKLGQMLSMDTGLVLSPQISQIFASLRDDAKHMPPKQLQAVLNAQWGPDWLKQFRRFDVRPFAAASIGQVHRAQTVDGQDLAIKVQYPGVRDSINSDVDNIATLMHLPGLVPPGLNLQPLLAEAKRQLHAEADYQAEANHLAQFSAWFAGSDMFLVPDLHPALCTSQVLAMRYVESAPLDSLTHAPQALRDKVAAALIDLVMREIFVFGAMQTDPNWANYRYCTQSGRIVLLDFGAVQPIATSLAANFRALGRIALHGGAAATRDTMLRIGYFGPTTAPHHESLIQSMFDLAMAPLRQPTPFDFGQSDLLERLRDMGLAIGSDRDLAHVPPAATLFLHRKIGGMYLMATKLRARVALRPMVETYCIALPTPR